MKKIHFLSAAFMAVALSMGFTSCGDDNNEIDAPIEKEEVEKADQNIEKMPEVALEAAANTEVVSKLTMAEGPLEEIFLVDNGKVIARKAHAARATGDDYVEGTYTVNSDGTVTAQLGGYTININISQNIVAIGDNTYTAELVKATPNGNASKSLCRTWYPTEYKVVAYAGTKAIGCYTSSTLVGLQNIASKELKADVKLLSGEVEKITFMDNNTIITNYKGNDYQVASWDWISEKLGALTVGFSSADSTLAKVPGLVRFQKGKPNTCYLVSAFQTVTSGKDKEDFIVDLKVVITLKDEK